MSESEEIKTMEEQELSSVSEESTSSLDDPGILLEPTKEGDPDFSRPQKVELKKHTPPVSDPSSTDTAVPTEEDGLVHSLKEVDPRAPQLGIEIGIDILLDRKKIPLTSLSTLAVGEILELSGGNFRATLFVQEKAIAEAALVMVDQRPAVQITKVFSVI